MRIKIDIELFLEAVRTEIEFIEFEIELLFSK
jgi:hypothetical protein